MTSSEARAAVAEAAIVLGIQRTLDVLIEYADTRLEDATTSNDKLARARIASDHRSLVTLRDKVHI